MIRIIIEIDDKQVSFTTTGPAMAPEPPRELLDRAVALGATSAGGAPGDATAMAEAASDAGAAPEVDGASESTEEVEPKRRSR